MNYRVSSIAIFCILVFGLSGCADTMYSMRKALGTTMLPQGMPFSEPLAKSDTEAIVYVYRPVGWAEVPEIVLSGKNLSLLAEGAYLVERVKPGPMSIRIQNPPSGGWTFRPIGVSVQVGAGDRRYFRIGTGIGGVLITPVIGGYTQEMKVEEVAEGVALSELAKLRTMR